MSEGKDNAVLERIESVRVKGFRSLADVKLDNIPNPMESAWWLPLIRLAIVAEGRLEALDTR